MQKFIQCSKNACPTALVIEDSPMIQKIHCLFLSKLGFLTNVAATAEQALQFFKIHSYTAVLLDNELSDGKGTEVCRAIRYYEKTHELPSIPIVAATSDISSKSDFFSAGCNDFVAKPITVDGLMKIFKKYFPVSQYDNRSNHRKNIFQFQI